MESRRPNRREAHLGRIPGHRTARRGHAVGTRHSAGRSFRGTRSTSAATDPCLLFACANFVKARDSVKEVEDQTARENEKNSLASRKYAEALSCPETQKLLGSKGLTNRGKNVWLIRVFPLRHSRSALSVPSFPVLLAPRPTELTRRSPPRPNQESIPRQLEPCATKTAGAFGVKEPGRKFVAY